MKDVMVQREPTPDPEDPIYGTRHPFRMIFVERAQIVKLFRNLADD